MVRKLLFFPLFLLTLISVGQTLSVGPRIGYASSGMSRQETGKLPVNSILAGGIVDFSFNELFSLQLEAYYLEKGGGYGFRLNGVNYSDYFTFKVVEFPLLAKFTVGNTKAKLILLGGPYLGYVTGGKWVYEDDLESYTEELTNFTFYDVDGIKTNRLDIGFQIGGGMSTGIGKGKLLLELRYGVGLTEWFKFETGQHYNMDDLNHRTFAITAGYIFPVWSND